MRSNGFHKKDPGRSFYSHPLQLTSEMRTRNNQRRRHTISSPRLPPNSPTPSAKISSKGELDPVAEKAKEKVESYHTDLEALIHATEQLTIARRMKDLSHAVMIDTLRNLRCSVMLKKKGNELADLLYSQHLKEVQRSECWSNNLLDALQNVQKTHYNTSTVLQDEYEKSRDNLRDFSEKHPELNLFSIISSSNGYHDSTDEEVSDSSILSTGAQSASSATSSNSTPTSSSIFSLFRNNSTDRKNLIELADGLRESLLTRRNDFVNAVNILEIKSANLVVDELNDLCNLYREVIDEEPEPLQPL